MTGTRTHVPTAAALAAVALVALSACGQASGDPVAAADRSAVTTGHSALREANEHQARRQLAELRERREHSFVNPYEHLGHRR